MRTKGAITKKECFNCKVVNNNGEILQDRNYITLRDIAKDLGMTYNQVVEITRNRRKLKTGKYDTNYFIGKIKEPQQDTSLQFKLDEENEDFNYPDNLPLEVYDDDGNIDEFLVEQIGQSNSLNI
mgnify:CR=1 FL=1|tara:strand:+ start:294 stop:668 length:375 start_codon:yes stop_codon:yes gene_type:complete